jgi:cell division septation protein DedD
MQAGGAIMGRKGSDQIERYNVGFFQSLTPASYVILILITAGIIAGTVLLFFGEEEEEVTTVAQMQPEVAPLARTPKVIAEQTMAPLGAEKPELVLEPISKEGHPDLVDDPLPLEQIEQKEWRAEILPLMEDTRPILGLDQNGSVSEAGKDSVTSEVPAEVHVQIAEGQLAEAPSSAPDVNVPEKTVSPPQPATVQGRWVVQLSVNKNPDLAHGWARRLQDLGANAYVLDRRTESGELHFLRMGFFSSREQARAKAEEIAARAGLSGYSLLEASSAEVERFARAN